MSLGKCLKVLGSALAIAFQIDLRCARNLGSPMLILYLILQIPDSDPLLELLDRYF